MDITKESLKELVRTSIMNGAMQFQIELVQHLMKIGKPELAMLVINFPVNKGDETAKEKQE